MNPETARPAVAFPSPKPGEERRTKSLAELAALQGITRPQDFEALFGAGADLWNDDADFQAFLAALRPASAATDEHR